MNDQGPEYIVVYDTLPYEYLSEYAYRLLEEISAHSDGSKDPDEVYYADLLRGYSHALDDIFCLTKHNKIEKLNKEIHRLAGLIKKKCEKICKEHQYFRSVEYCREIFSHSPEQSEKFEKILSAASADEIIDLKYIAWNSVDCTGEDFYDAFEELEKKYLKEHAE